MSSNLLTARLATPKGTHYALTDGPKMTHNWHGEATLTATYRIFVSSLADFLDELMPAPIQPLGSTVVYLEPTLKITNYAGSPNIFSPVRASVEGLSSDKPVDYFNFDATAPSGTYNRYALVTVDFATNRDSFYNVRRTNANPETFLEPTFSTTAEVISYKVDKNLVASTTVSPSGAQSTIKDFSAPLTAIIPICERTYRWSWALNPDFNKIFRLIGKLNSAALAWADYSPVGTMMFMGISGKQEYHWGGGGKRVLAPWNIEYKFAQRCAVINAGTAGETPITWNHFFNPDTGTFQYLKRKISDTAAQPLYSSGDYSQLFHARVTT